MIPFVIKSAICLTILYGFYHLFLYNLKVFVFNRYYLLFSLLFAIATPLITARISLSLPVSSNIQKFSNISADFIQYDNLIISNHVQYLTFYNVALILYLIVSIILLLRFTINICKIIQQIRAGSAINNDKTSIVLVENKALPYSFFKYIFINRFNYENGKIEKELIIHEQTHCLQYHSVDILIVELVKIVMWFNPILWLFRKAIQLNHEFLADNKVLSTQSLSDYQNILVNLVFRNNSIYLASNLNYSLTKKRLIMMTQNNSLRKATLRKIATVPVFLFLAISLLISQESTSVKTEFSGGNEWWYSSLKKHGFTLDKNHFTTLVIANKIINLHCEDVKVAFNEGDTVVFIVESSKAIIDMEKMYYEFSDGKTFRYYKNGDYENGGFKTMKINNNSPSTKSHNNVFQNKLVAERKAAADEQVESFQKGLAEERKAAAIEQSEYFQEKLAYERKGAAEGTIVVGSKQKNSK